MKEVTKDEFYNIIYTQKLDIVATFENDRFPYTQIHKFRNGKLFGKKVDSWKDGVFQQRPIETKYYIFN